MNYISVLILALALSLDAFGVAFGIGLNGTVNKHKKILFSISFGFFQFFFAIIGASFGYWFYKNIYTFPSIFGGGIIAIVGILMLREGFQIKEESLILSRKMYFILGMSVSIDALVVGFTSLGNASNYMLVVIATIIIGIVSLINTSFAFIISRSLKKISFIEKYADFVGGIILILFGLKMMFFN